MFSRILKMTVEINCHIQHHFPPIPPDHHLTQKSLINHPPAPLLLVPSSDVGEQMLSRYGNTIIHSSNCRIDGYPSNTTSSAVTRWIPSIMCASTLVIESL